MYNKAIDKLRDEMANNQGFDMLTELGEMLCRWLKDNRYAAEKILQEDKSLEGAIKALEAEARKHRGSKNCVCIPPEKARKLVLEYYGVSDAEKAAVRRGNFEVNLDDLLGD